MGQQAGQGESDNLAALIAHAGQMDAARFILEVAALGADPVEVCAGLSVESLGL